MSKLSEHVISEWYVLKGEHRFGPFEYVDLVRMLQEKVIYGFDYAWHGGLNDWQRISEITDFQETAIRTLLTDRKVTRGIFIERKHPRLKHSGRLIVHDQNRWWRGQALEISAGGVGLIMENSMVVPGQQLYIHFKPFDKFPAFNANGEIVNKRYSQDVKATSAPIEYGIRFLSVSGTGKDKLLELLGNVAAAAA